MLKHPMILRGLFARTLLGLVAASVSVLAVYAALHRLTNDRPWIEPVTVVALSLVLATVAGVILQRLVLRPMRDRLATADSTLERAILMQEAMKPALSMLAEGLAHQHLVLEEIALDFGERRDHDEGEHHQPKSRGISPRVLRLAASLKDLRKDAASRAQIANTLLAANDTVGLRHAELQRSLGAIKGVLKSGKSPIPTPDGKFDASGTTQVGPTFGLDAVPMDGAAEIPPFAGTNYSWPSDPIQPLIPNFNIPKNQGRGRFGRN